MSVKMKRHGYPTEPQQVIVVQSNREPSTFETIAKLGCVSLMLIVVLWFALSFLAAYVYLVEYTRLLG